MTTIKEVTISKMTGDFLRNHFYYKQFNEINEKDLESLFNNDLFSFDLPNKSLILNELSEICEMIKDNHLS